MDTVCPVDVEVIRLGQICANRTLRTSSSTSLRVIFRTALSSPESSDESVTEGIADGQVTVTTSTTGDGPWREAKLSDLLGDARHIRFHLDKDKSTLHFMHLAQVAALAASHSPTYTDDFKRPGDAAPTWGTKPTGTLHDFDDLPSAGNLDPGLMYAGLRNGREEESTIEWIIRLATTPDALKEYLVGPPLFVPNPRYVSDDFPSKGNSTLPTLHDPMMFMDSGLSHQVTPEQIDVTPSPLPSSLPQPSTDPTQFMDSGLGHQGTPEQIHVPPEVPRPTLPHPTNSTDLLDLGEDKRYKPPNSTDLVAPTLDGQALLSQLLSHLLGVFVVYGLLALWHKWVGTGKGQVPPGRVKAVLAWCSGIYLALCVVKFMIGWFHDEGAPH